jgi:hypothetical protein
VSVDLKKLYADPRHAILVEVLRVLDGQRVWGGQEFTYGPIHPHAYRPLAAKVQAEFDKMVNEYETDDGQDIN